MDQRGDHGSGKRELPAGIRSRFTELWVAEPGQRSDLEALVAAYLLGTAAQPPIAGVVDFYLAAREAAVRMLPLNAFMTGYICSSRAPS